MFCLLFILLQILSANWIVVTHAAIIVAGICALAEMIKKFLYFCIVTAERVQSNSK